MNIRLLLLLTLIMTSCLLDPVPAHGVFNWPRNPTDSESHPRQDHSSIGPWEWTSEDGTSTLRLGFAGQLRTVFQSRDQGPDSQRSEKWLLEARRVRLVLSGIMLQSRLRYRLHLSTAPGSMELMDLYFNYQISDRLQLRYGQYKVPFTRYRIQSFQRLTFADWALVTRYFGAERQMGLSIHNGYERPATLSYVAGLFTGVNARASHAIGLPMLYGTEISNPSDLAHSGPPAEFHPELFFHLAYQARGIQVQSDTDEQRGPLRYCVVLSAAWDLDPAVTQDMSGRLAPELLVKYRGISAAGLGYAGFGQVGTPAGTELIMLGALLQTAYRINDKYEVAARYAMVDVRDALGNDLRQVSEASPSEQASRMEEITAGFNIYVLGHNIKWQNDMVWLRQSLTETRRNDFTARSQLQLAF